MKNHTKQEPYDPAVTSSRWLGHSPSALIEKVLDWLVLTWPFDQVAEIGGRIRIRQVRKLYADMGIKLDKNMNPIGGAGAKSTHD